MKSSINTRVKPKKHVRYFKSAGRKKSSKSQFNVNFQGNKKWPKLAKWGIRAKFIIFEGELRDTRGYKGSKWGDKWI